MRYIKNIFILAILIILIICSNFIFNSNILASKKGGSTNIAYWNFKDNVDKTNVEISLADTITKSYCEIADGYIAPGTEGKFDIIVNGEGSNIGIDYRIMVIREENVPSNLYFFLNDNSDEKFNSIKDLFNKKNFSGSLNFAEKNFMKYEIYWRWPFETKDDKEIIDNNKDIEDTNFAKMQKDYIFEIEISGKQSNKK